MNYTPRLKNLLWLRRALLALSDAVSNLTDDDVDIIETAYNIPSITRLNNFSDFLADVTRKRITVTHQAALPADQADLFCPLCENETTHQRMVTGPVSRYKCTKCGLVGGEL